MWDKQTERELSAARDLLDKLEDESKALDVAKGALDQIESLTHSVQETYAYDTLLQVRDIVRGATGKL